MITVDAMGDTCPIPVVKTKNAIKELHGPGIIEIFVDNEIAVQNLTKMAKINGYGVKSQKLTGQKYRVEMEILEASEDSVDRDTDSQEENTEKKNIPDPETISCIPDARKNIVVAFSSNKMGEGNDELGATLMKGFIYALSQEEQLPSTLLFYNSGVKLTTEASPVIEDLKSLEAQGVEIYSCGTCLNFYGLTDQLQVGSVTNMYDIVEKMTQAELMIKP